MAEPQTFLGFPVVIRDDVPKGEVVFGPMPTREDVLRHGSYETAVEAMKQAYVRLKLDDETLASDILD